MRVLPVRPANIAWANASWRGLLDAGIFGLSGLLKKVFEVSRWATLIQDPSARRTKDSQPSGFGFEYCASHVRFRVFQQTAKGDLVGLGQIALALVTGGPVSKLIECLFGFLGRNRNLGVEVQNTAGEKLKLNMDFVDREGREKAMALVESFLKRGS